MPMICKICILTKQTKFSGELGLSAKGAAVCIVELHTLGELKITSHILESSTGAQR